MAREECGPSATSGGVTSPIGPKWLVFQIFDLIGNNAAHPIAIYKMSIMRGFQFCRKSMKIFDMSPLSEVQKLKL